jgi:hypothetical protein
VGALVGLALVASDSGLLVAAGTAVLVLSMLVGCTT